MVEYGILGPLTARVDGQPVDLGGPRTRAVLAVLLLDRNAVVSVDRLVDLVWGDAPPPTAETALQGHISRLRRLLGAPAIETRPPGYVLRVGAGEVDVERFEAFVLRARAAAPREAGELLREALALWQGPALADLAYEPFAEVDIARLEELRMGALEARIEADLAAGRHEALAGELEALVAEHPYRERLHGQRILALYRSGRQAEALAAYRAARTALDEGLGIDPGPDLQALEVRILQQDPTLAAPAAEVAAPPTAIPAPSRVASHVGTALTPLVGRERELRAIESRLANGARLVTLTGPGGSGKTRLAREVFGRHRIQGASAYFVDLVGIGDPGLVPAEIATELGVSETADRDAAGAVVAALRDAAAVVVLDNLEELLGARDFLADLLRAAPELQLIATSRIPLGIRGEVEFQVPPLDLPHGDGPAEVEASPAGTLFLERARAVGRLDEVDAPTATAIAELCRRLDGLPLALELAAARTRILPPAAILRHLVEHTSGLLAKVGEEDVRHESLDAVLSWSLDLLESNEAEVLGAVAICPGGFDLPMAEALAPDLNVLQALDVLATHGLLVPRGEVEGEPWYRLLETIRMAALQRASQEATTTRWEALANHLSGRVAGALEAYRKIDEVAFRRLDALLDDIRAVLDWTAVNDPALNLSIAAQFWPYWRARGRSREALQRLRGAIAANRDPSSDLALALVGLATLGRDSGDLREHRRAGAEAARIARIVRDPELEIGGLVELVTAADAAMPEVSNRLRELLPTLEHPVARSLCITSLAIAEALESGSGYEGMTLAFREALEAVAGTPYRRGQGNAAGNLAQICLYVDRPIDAFEHSTGALVALGEGGPNQLVWIHSLRATAAAAIGRFSEAIASLRSAFELTDDVRADLEVTPEMMVAAVAVLAVSDAPLLAARVWGAMTTGDFNESLFDDDRALAERLLVPARRATDPASFEVAIKAGQNAGVARVVDEVLAQLDVIAASGGQVRPDLGAATRLEAALRARELGIVDPTLDDS